MLRPVVLPPHVPGTLWLSSMPGRFSPWQAFESEARQAQLALVVCLTPRHELAELSPAYHRALAQDALPFRWLNLPMPNFGLPDDPPAFRREIARIARALRKGNAVMLHCAAGLGDLALRHASVQARQRMRSIHLPRGINTLAVRISSKTERSSSVKCSSV